MDSHFRTLTNITIAAVCLAAIAALYAGGYIGLFNDLSFDDIIRKTSGVDSVYYGAKAFYFGETGRFTNGLLTQHSGLYELAVYRKLHLVLGFFWVLSVWLFFSSFIKLTRSSGNAGACLLFTSSIILIFIANAPNLGEWWFWYTTASLYLAGSSLALIGFYFYISALRQNRPWQWWTAGLILFLAAGNSEMVMLAVLAVCIAILPTQIPGKFNWYVCIPLVWVVAAVILVIASPGTSARLEMVTGTGHMQMSYENLRHLPLNIITTLGKGLSYWVSDSFWLLALSIAFFMGLILRGNNSFKTSTQTLLILSLVAIMVLCSQAALVVLMDWKININDASRTSNQAYFWFLILLILVGFVIGQLTHQTLQSLGRINVAARTGLIITSSILIFNAWHGKNIMVMADDILLNKPSRQEESILEWDRLIEQAKQQGLKNIVVHNMVPANTLTVYRRGPSIDPEYPMNRYWAKYKGLAKDVSFTRHNFDKRLFQSVQNNYTPLDKQFNLLSYRDRYRNYALIQVPKSVKSDRKLCLTIEPENNQTFTETLKDENFSKLEFRWHKNQHCTRFGRRRMFCERFSADWVCRIPLPQEFTGKIKANWENSFVEIQSSAND